MRAETVQTDQRAYKVRYKDGTVESYLVTWLAQIDLEVHEDGGPAKPLEGKFIDDQRCHWIINAHIDRQVAMANKAGQQFAQSSLSRRYNSNFRYPESPWVIFNFRSESCNDAAARRENDLNNGRQGIGSEFAGVVAADLDKLKQEVKAGAEVISVDF
jgi:hypothetical protein